MKRSLLTAFCLVLGASMAIAQPDVGTIDVFSDPGLADCNFTDSGPVLITVYVAATNSADGTSAAQWKMVIPSTWTFFGQVSPYPTVVGNVLEGISIGYGQCLSGDAFLILTVNMLGDGLSPTCSHISIVPDPDAPSGQIEIVDCQLPLPEKWLSDAAGQGVVNGDGSCPCNVPVQDTTWGGIKALYN
ncbi:MAG: hypothetical protein KAT30_02560 [Candidatus Krumholzibacteria bacterium]|nr:hypothetical protein [Candidatus Krumholzibacteria bacterium]